MSKHFQEINYFTWKYIVVHYYKLKILLANVPSFHVSFLSHIVTFLKKVYSALHVKWNRNTKSPHMGAIPKILLAPSIYFQILVYVAITTFLKFIQPLPRDICRCLPRKSYWHSVLQKKKYILWPWKFATKTLQEN